MGSRVQDIQLSKSLCYNPFFVCRSVSLYSNHTTNGCRPVTPLALSTKESCADCKWLRKKGSVNLRRHDYSLICWNEEWNWNTDLRRILHNVYLLWHYPNTAFLFLVTVWPVSLDTLEGKIPGVGAGSQKQSSGHIWDFLCSLCVLSKLSSAHGRVNALGSTTVDLHHSALQQRVGDSEGAGQEPLKGTRQQSSPSW